MEITYVARLTDGLIFCESWGTNPSMNEFKRQARQILKCLGRGCTTQQRCTIDSTSGVVFNYLIDNGVVFMTLCQKSYNKKLAFLFLEELARDFQEELKLEFGTHSTDYRSIIETIEKPYYFIRFDEIDPMIGIDPSALYLLERTITKKKQEFKDPNSSRVLQKLTNSLSEVTNIMRQNVEDILQRGEDLASVSQKADDLKASSSKFATLINVVVPLLNHIVECKGDQLLNVTPEELFDVQPLSSHVSIKLTHLLHQLRRDSQPTTIGAKDDINIQQISCDCFNAVVDLHRHSWLQLHAQPWKNVGLFWRRVYGIASYLLAALYVLRLYLILNVELDRFSEVGYNKSLLDVQEEKEIKSLRLMSSETDLLNITTIQNEERIHDKILARLSQQTRATRDPIIPKTENIKAHSHISLPSFVECNDLLDGAFYYADMGLILGGFVDDFNFDVLLNLKGKDKVLEQKPEQKHEFGDSSFYHDDSYRPLCLGLIPHELQKLFGSSTRSLNANGTAILPMLHSVLLTLRDVQDIVPVVQKITEKEAFDTHTSIQMRLGKALKLKVEKMVVEELDLSIFSFIDKYLKSQQPVILRGACSHFPAVSKWKDIKKRLLELGERRLVPVEVGSSYTENRWTQKIITIRDFVAKYIIDNPQELGYLAQHPILEHMPQLQDEFLTPEFCMAGSCEYQDIIRLVWIGPSNTISPFHTDPHENLFAQISGHKYVRLISSLYTTEMYPYKTMLSNTSSVSPPDVTIYKVNASAYPNFPHEDYLEAVLGPGDLLFIPCKWWHFIKSLSPSVSVSYWFDN